MARTSAPAPAPAPGSGRPSAADWRSLLSAARSEATAPSPVGTNGRRARPAAGIPVASAYVSGLSAADRAIMRSADWLTVSGDYAPGVKPRADRPAMPIPCQRPSASGKVRSAHAYDPETLARLRAEAAHAEAARYDLLCMIAATLNRSKGRIAVVDVAAMVGGLGLKESLQSVVTFIIKRLNLAVTVKAGFLTCEETIPTHNCHAGYAQAANLLIADYRVKVSAG